MKMCTRDKKICRLWPLLAFVFLFSIYGCSGVTDSLSSNLDSKESSPQENIQSIKNTDPVLGNQSKNISSNDLSMSIQSAYLSTGNIAIATINIKTVYTPSGNYVPSQNYVKNVEISAQSYLLSQSPFPQTDVYLLRYNWTTRQWSYVNFYYSNGRNDNWRGPWGEEDNGSFSGPLSLSEPTFVDYNAPQGWNIYYIFAWSWLNGWQTDGWIISNWVYID